MHYKPYQTLKLTFVFFLNTRTDSFLCNPQKKWGATPNKNIQNHPDISVHPDCNPEIKPLRR